MLGLHRRTEHTRCPFEHFLDFLLVWLLFNACLTQIVTTASHFAIINVKEGRTAYYTFEKLEGKRPEYCGAFLTFFFKVFPKFSTGSLCHFYKA